MFNPLQYLHFCLEHLYMLSAASQITLVNSEPCGHIMSSNYA